MLAIRSEDLVVMESNDTSHEQRAWDLLIDLSTLNLLLNEMLWLGVMPARNLESTSDSLSSCTR